MNFTSIHEALQQSKALHVNAHRNINPFFTELFYWKPPKETQKIKIKYFQINQSTHSTMETTRNTEQLP